MMMALLVGTADVAEQSGKQLERCREDTWRVAVMPKHSGNLKHRELPRYEKRSLLVCDEKFFSE